MEDKAILDLIASELRSAAYLAGGEAAWPRQEAITAIEQFASSGYVVLGVETWLPTVPGPTIPFPYIYVWEITPRRELESWAQFVARSKSESQKFIQGFEWDPSDKENLDAIPFFNFTLCPESEYGQK